MTSRIQIMISNSKAYIFISLFVLILIFMISPDSYTHYSWNRCDSAWYFICGKAWMNGMTPYVDFADSKGPLLWLIYGIGYLLSPDTYHGVFWISCFFYSVTFFYFYKSIRIVFSERLALIGVCLIGLFYFYYGYHYETRAEDFCLTFMAMALYHSLSIIINDTLSVADLKKRSLMLGIAFGACLMIKFTMAVMVGMMMLCMFIKCINRQNGKENLLFMILGALIVCSPFVLYLIITGSFIPMIQEYFINTSMITRGVTSVSKDLSLLVTCKKRWIVIVFLSFSATRVVRKQFGWFPLITSAVILIISLMHSIEDYYLTVNAVTSYYLVIYVLSVISKKWEAKSFPICFLPVSAMSVIILTALTHYMLGNHSNLYLNKELNDEYESFTLPIKELPSKKLVNIGCENGFGIEYGTLPGCKYWARQNGASDSMIEDQINAIEDRIPDVVIWTTALLPDTRPYDEILARNGYVVRTSIIQDGVYPTYLFVKQ